MFTMKYKQLQKKQHIRIVGSKLIQNFKGSNTARTVLKKQQVGRLTWFQDLLHNCDTLHCIILSKDGYISMKQNRQSRNILILICPIYFPQRWQGNLMNERKIFQQTVLEQLELLKRKKKWSFILTSCYSEN